MVKGGWTHFPLGWQGVVSTYHITLTLCISINKNKTDFYVANTLYSLI